MIKFFDILNMMYTKKKVDIKPDTSLNITLGKWLSYDKSNLASLKKLLKYQFYINPKHFFYMLFFAIPKKSRAPFLKKIGKDKEKENKLIDKIQYVLGWSNKELSNNMSVLTSCLLTNEKYWKRELGIK